MGTHICREGSETRKDMRVGAGQAQVVNLLQKQAWKKLLVQVTEDWLNACESDKSKKEVFTFLLYMYFNTLVVSVQIFFTWKSA